MIEEMKAVSGGQRTTFDPRHVLRSLGGDEDITIVREYVIQLLNKPRQYILAVSAFLKRYPLLRAEKSMEIRLRKVVCKLSKSDIKTACRARRSLQLPKFHQLLEDENDKMPKTLPDYRCDLPVILVDTMLTLALAAATILKSKICGLDAEWEGKNSSNICVLQIATRSKRFVLDLKVLPLHLVKRFLNAMFSESGRIVLGFNSVSHDFPKLFKQNLLDSIKFVPRFWILRPCSTDVTPIFPSTIKSWDFRDCVDTS